LVIGIVIALSITIIATYWKLDINTIINLFSFLRLIPGIAILLIAMPVLGVGTFPTIVTLTILTIPPILINCYSGIKNISPILVETSDAIGMTPRQILFKIQLPMASPFILLGIRTAVVDVIAIAIIAAYMGAGGLGRYILTGILINDMRMNLVGSILITLMAFASESFFGHLQRNIEKKCYGK
jgi:osmoprotectant transport system permease protein